MTLPRLSLGLIFSLILGPSLAFAQFFDLKSNKSPEQQFAPPPVEDEEEKTPAQYWAETDINIGMLLNRQMLNNQSCGQELKIFKACVKVMNAIAGASEPALEVVPESLIGRDDFVTGQAGRPLGSGLRLVETVKISSSKASLRERMESLAQRGHIFDAEVEKLFDSVQRKKQPWKNRKSVDLDFAAMAVELLQKDVSRSQQALAIAAGISAFMSETLDPHSSIEAKAVISRASRSSDSIVGIGAKVQVVDSEIVVTELMEGGSAEPAGVKPGDVILSVNEESMLGLDASQAVKKIRGPEDSQLRLRLRRQNQEIEISLVRKKVTLENVSVRVQEELGQKLLVVKMASFMDGTACSKIQESILKLQRIHSDLKGIIFDVRNNPGGRMDQAICIGGLFVGKKVIVKVKDLNSAVFTDLKSPRQQITVLPLVMLINAGSASASELLTGALRDHARAWAVGQRSYGKGTVQDLWELTPSILIKKTISRFYQPGGTTNQLVGITPDFEVPPKLNATADDVYAVRELDLYPNAISSDSAKWVQTRSVDIARIESCRRQNRAEASISSDMPADYQLRVAAEILMCDEQTKDLVQKQSELKVP